VSLAGCYLRQDFPVYLVFLEYLVRLGFQDFQALLVRPEHPVDLGSQQDQQGQESRQTQQNRHLHHSLRCYCHLFLSRNWNLSLSKWRFGLTRLRLETGGNTGSGSGRAP